MSRVSSAIYEYLAAIVTKENIVLDEPMSGHVTFNVGGKAQAFVQVETEAQLVEVIKFLNRLEEEYFILGNGSNLLVGDKGYQGIIVQIGPKMSGIEVIGERIIAKAGAPLSKVAKAACDNGLSGLEFASGIPGTIGGAVVMNAGAYGGEMKQLVTRVRVVNADGEVMELDNGTMEFGYRNSVIRNKKFAVLEVEMSLQKGDEGDIQRKIAELSGKRREKQPLEYPSAGSTFKRPDGYYAGKLIMDAGMRGYSIGGAQVSEKHCGFVVNRANATAEDIIEVIHTVQEKVYDLFNVRLELEIICLGEF